MNDIAKIERALKDADISLEKLYDEIHKNTDIPVPSIRRAITEALMLLRKQPFFPKPQLLLSEAKLIVYLIDEFGNRLHRCADNLRQAIKINGG